MSYNGDQIHHMKRISRGSMAHWLKMLQAQLLEAFLYSIFCVFLYIFSAHTTLVYRPLSLARQNHKKIRENEFALSLSSSYFKAQSAFQWDLSVREPTHTTTPATIRIFSSTFHFVDGVLRAQKPFEGYFLRAPQFLFNIVHTQQEQQQESSFGHFSCKETSWGIGSFLFRN